LLLCCLSTALPAETATAAERTGTVTATELNVRKSPSSNAEKLRSVRKGTALTILETTGDWYKVRFGKVVGYVAKQYVALGGSSSASSSSPGKSGTIASLGSAPMASKPGENNKHVEKLQKALQFAGYYDGRISGNYGDLTKQAVQKLQKAKGLKADGIAGDATIKALFGTKAVRASTGSSKKKTEMPDWSKGGNSAVPKDASFTVKDVRSGRIFKARRWSGGSHIDAEPLNKSATDTIKKCFGGKFSWDRRPILIEYRGHIYAASMNGMPHSTYGNIKNNNFSGVFCIHFYKSKTHGTVRVDPAHQACVSEAAKDTW
jgi:uncharacterized protein YraI